MATIAEIMQMTAQERHNAYGANVVGKDIQYVEIDGIRLSGYEAYSFFWEKTYNNQPKRASGGAMTGLNDLYSTFISGHLKLNFALMSIDDYRKIMKLIYTKNEFTVKCYDIIYNKQVELKMYFSPQEQPKLWNIVSKIQAGNSEWESWLDLVGIQGATVELIGTNSDNDKFINYFTAP